VSFRPIAGDPWWLARAKLKNGLKYYGAYPAGFLWRARALLGIHINAPLLHVCGGRVKDYAGDSRGLGPNDKTIDLDETLKPDFNVDVRTLGSFPGSNFPLYQPGAATKCEVLALDKETKFDPAWLWPAALLDRPYTSEDATHYLDGKGAEVFPDELNALLYRALSLVVPGGRVGVLDYEVPKPPEWANFISATPVYIGFNNRGRTYCVFERDIKAATVKPHKKRKVTTVTSEETIIDVADDLDENLMPTEDTAVAAEPNAPATVAEHVKLMTQLADPAPVTPPVAGVLDDF
jgi:hypothetical protein